jgi:hypothetical protein
MFDRKNTPDFKGVNTNLSYYRIRKWIGIFGLLLPILAPWFAGEQLSSFSAYYYTKSSILFTSTLILIGVFLVAYHGYDQWDNRITWLGGICILVAALVPTPIEACCTRMPPIPVCPCENADKLFGFLPHRWIHFYSAAIFFVCMAIMSIRQFTQGALDQPGKKLKNWVYYSCGYGILASIIFGFVMIFIFKADNGTRFIYWMEVFMLELFAIAWLIKGRIIEDILELIGHKASHKNLEKVELINK